MDRLAYIAGDTAVTAVLCWFAFMIMLKFLKNIGLDVNVKHPAWAIVLVLIWGTLIISGFDGLPVGTWSEDNASCRDYSKEYTRDIMRKTGEYEFAEAIENAYYDVCMDNSESVEAQLDYLSAEEAQRIREDNRLILQAYVAAAEGEITLEDILSVRFSKKKIKEIMAHIRPARPVQLIPVDKGSGDIFDSIPSD